MSALTSTSAAVAPGPCPCPSPSDFSSSSSLLVIYATHDLQQEQEQDKTTNKDANQDFAKQGVGVNKPVVRKRGIIDALRAAAASDSSVSFEPVTEPTADLSVALKVHSPGLVDLFETGFQRWAAMGYGPGGRDQYFTPKGRVEREEDEDWSELVPSQILPRDACQRPGNSVHGQVCYYAQDRNTPLTAHVRDMLRNDLAVTLAAVKAVQTGSHRQVYACTTQPGHHSSTNSYGGYCYINQAALAARLLSEQHGKVALLDVDYHSGNGSMSVFWTDPSVFVCSIHAHPDIAYPYGMGWEDQDGEGEAKGTKLNIPLGMGITWKEYEVALKRALDAIQSFGAKYLVVSLGLDTLAHDPEASAVAGFMLQPDDYPKMGHMIRATNIPIIWVQEGGYKLDQAGEVVTKSLL